MGMRLNKTDVRRLNKSFIDLNKLPKELKKAIQRESVEIAEDAIQKAPVLTGRLRDSIEYNKTDKGADVSVNVPYADDVNYGTRSQRAQPFFTDAIRTGRRRMSSRIKKILNRIKK